MKEDSEIYCSVTDALSFTTWKSKKEIVEETGYTSSEVTLAIKKLQREGELDSRNKKYKYFNADD